MSLSVNEGYAYAGLKWLRKNVPVNPATGESYSVSHISEVLTDMRDKGLLVKKRNKKNGYLLNPMVVGQWEAAMKNIGDGNMPGADEMVEITLEVGEGVPVGGTVLSEVGAAREERRASRKARKYSETAGYYKEKREAREAEAKSRLEVGGTRWSEQVEAEREERWYQGWVAKVVGEAGEVGEVIGGLIAKFATKVLMSDKKAEEVCGTVTQALVKMEIGKDEWVGRLANEIVFLYWRGWERQALPYSN